jgi:hypothetical protein
MLTLLRHRIVGVATDRRWPFPPAGSVGLTRTPALAQVVAATRVLLDLQILTPIQRGVIKTIAANSHEQFFSQS